MQKVKEHGRLAWEDFSGGDYGVTHPRHAAPNQFHAKNIVVYRDGTMGPRNGLVLQPLNGATYVNGALNALFFGVEHTLSTPRMVFSQGTRPAYFLVNTTSAQAPGTFTGPGGTPDPFDFDEEPTNGKLGILPRLGFQTFFSVLEDGTYLLDNLSDEIHKLTGDGAYGAHDVVEYLDQIYLIGIGTGADGRGHKVTYSDHADPEDWPDANIFLVGYAWVIIRGVRMLNGLLMATQDQRWYLLQGTPETGSLRNVAMGRGPQVSSPWTVQVDQERAFYLASGASGGAFPAVFDGSENDTDSYKHLRGWMSGSVAATAILSDTSDRDLMFVGTDQRALLRHEGIWTRHEYEVEVSNWGAPYADQKFYLAVDGDETHKPVFYRSDFAIEGPAIKDSLWQSPGDGSDTPVDAWVEFPEAWQKDGSTMRPMHVLVEFTSYDTGASVDAHLDVEVDVINRFGKEAIKTHPAGAWDESDATTASTTTGVRRKLIARSIPAGSFGAGVQVRLKNVRGVKIERVVLDYELAEQLDVA